MTKDKRSGGGSDEVQSTKVDSPDAPARKTADPAKGAEFSGVEATGPTAQEITAKVDPESGVVYPEDPTVHPNLGGTGQVGPGRDVEDRRPNEETPKNADGTAKGVDVGVLSDSAAVSPKSDPVTADVVPRSLDTMGRMPNEETPKTADGKAKIAGGDRKRFRVTFNPPSPVGDRAKLFDCEATDAADALAQWRTFTGFSGETAVEPVITEVTE